MSVCKECVHFDWEGRNPNYMGGCDNCKRNPNYNDWFTKLEVCRDTHCGSYGKCDKIHCMQFYDYFKNGTIVIKRD